MRYGSVCSGIEAASVAWHSLGWEAAWLAEIEPFPSAVLKHHYPTIPNYGDMTALADRVSNLEIEAPDVLVGGTPCQAFSVAGLRQSLDDNRGQLTIKFLELAGAIDTVRRNRGEPECIIVWENVPGVLSTKDNALGCFLAGLAGESEPLLPAGGKWSNAGCVFGPARTVAWRVLDAQYFGVAQRRRRVFVVASARDGFDPVEVLFEFDSLRRDIAPSRAQRKGVAGGVAIGPSGGCLSDLNPTLDTRAKDSPIRNQLAGAVLQVTPIQNATRGKSQNGIGIGSAGDSMYTLDQASQHAVFAFSENMSEPTAAIPINSMNAFRSPDADKSTGCGLGEEGEAMFTITKTHHHAVAAFKGGQGAAARSIGYQVEQSPTLSASEGGNRTPIVLQPIAFTITKTHHHAVAAQGITLHGTDGTQSVASFTELSSSLRARIPSGVENSTTAVLQSIAFEPGFLKREGTHFYYEHTGALRRTPSDNAMAVAFAENSRGEIRLEGGDGKRTGALSTGGGKPGQGAPMVAVDVAGTMKACKDSGGWSNSADHAAAGYMQVVGDMRVRRLTPTECERLQGFPDGYTLVPHRGKPAADGPRYKSLGNSMAVPVMAWIGKRIDQAIQ